MLRGKVQAAALNENEFRKLALNHAGVFTILFRSVDVPRHVVSHRKDLDIEVLSGVERALLNMDGSEAGKAVLNGFQRTLKFDRLPRSTGDVFQTISQLARHVDSELGE